MTSSTTVFKSAGACTDNTLPILYRDPAASAGSLFCYDALDSFSWPSQVAPTPGASLVDLLGIANATFGTPGITWNNGFVFDSADADVLTLPASSKQVAGVVGFAIAMWIKWPTATAALRGVMDLTDGSAATSQYALYRDGTNSLILRGNGGASGPTPLVAATVYQVAITTELAAGNLTIRLWLNGVQKVVLTRAAPMLVPAKAAMTIGGLSELGPNGDDFVLYRVHADNLTTRSAAQFVSDDFAAGNGRFA